MKSDLRPLIAEWVGTFTLVFIGAGAGALASTNGGGIVAVALAHGIALMVIVYAWGAVSGAHVNPAVTFSLALVGVIDWTKALTYWIFQFGGASLAGLLLFYLFGTDSNFGATVGSLTMTDPLKTIVVEAILTFFLVTAVFGSAVAGRNGNAVGIAIGSVLAMDILMGGALTGASMNPARTFGSALAAADLSYLWMYIVGPFIGGGAASLLYDRLFLTD